MSKRPIGIFDSGVGGLTVMREVTELLPCEDIIYLGDTARFPYGSKTVEQLKEFVLEIVTYLRQQDVKVVVVACNSASSAGLETAQKHFGLPLIGVIEPGAKAAVQATLSRRVGVIGTEATINSRSYEKAIHVFDAGIRVYSQACPELADFVEQGKTTGREVGETIKRCLAPLLKAGIDSLILGCTHYPLLSEAVQKVAGSKVRLISSAEEVAKELKETLERKKQLCNLPKNPHYRFTCTSDETKFLELGSRFFGQEIASVEKVALSELTPIAKKE